MTTRHRCGMQRGRVVSPISRLFDATGDQYASDRGGCMPVPYRHTYSPVHRRSPHRSPTSHTARGLAATPGGLHRAEPPMRPGRLPRLATFIVVLFITCVAAVVLADGGAPTSSNALRRDIVGRS